MALVNDVYRYLGLFVEIPSDILRLGKVTRFFRDEVRRVAINAFFIRNAQTIREIGFHPISDKPFENFRHLYRLIALRCINEELQYEKLPLSLTDYLACSKQSIICHSRIDKMFTVQRAINRTATQVFDGFFGDLLPETTKLSQIVNPQPDEEIECEMLIFFIPFKITSFQNLKEITLSDHHITIVPSFLSQLKSLEYLTLERNRIHDVECPFSEMGALEWVDLKQNLLTELPRASLFSQTKPLSIKVDIEAALHFSDSLEHYSCVLIDMHCDALPDFQLKEKVAKVLSHNVTFLKKFLRPDRRILQDEMNVQKTLDNWTEKSDSEAVRRQIQDIQRQIMVDWIMLRSFRVIP